MKNVIINSFLLIFFFSITSTLYAQERIIKGSVTTLEDIAVVKAEVKVLRSKVIVLTDSLGNFEISCLPNDKIKISANGFNPQKFKIEKQTKEILINLKFKPSEKNLDEVVGYGHIKEIDKSYALRTIKNYNENKFAGYADMYELLRDSSPSIIIKGSVVYIRGNHSLNGGNNALIMVDGTALNSTQLNSLSPQNVKSVKVLQGRNAAVYGSRGANGVVIITTKG